MKQKIFTFALLTTFCLTGCNAQEKQSYIQNKKIAYYDIGYNVYENGLLYTDELGQTAYFLDYETMNGVPLCNKPNCTHKDTSCISKLCISPVSPMTFIYNDYLYWFNSEYKIAESADGKSQEAEIHTKCIRAALNTGELETFAEIDGVFMDSQIDLAIVGDTLYIIGSYQLHLNEDGTYDLASRSKAQYLYSLNLESADVKNHGQINDSPYAENNWIHGVSVFSEVEIDGVYNDKLYMHYRYVKNPQDMIDFLEQDPFNNNISASELPWVYENKCLDLETGEINVSDLPYAWWIQDNTYIYQEDETFFVMDKDGNSVAAGNMYENECYDFTFVNGKLWKCSSGNGFDPEIGAEFILKDKYAHFGAAVMDFVNGQYIVQYYDEKNNLSFDHVSEEDLIGE